MVLRIISVSPFEMGIVDKQPSVRTKRGLMLMSKILQNIANHVEFSKEQHMLPFNDFLRANFELGRRYVTKTSNLEPYTALLCLWQFICTLSDNLLKPFCSYYSIVSQSYTSFTYKRKINICLEI